MPNHAHITILGHAGKDPELRTLQDGTPIANFSVAVKGYDKQTTWYAVSVFGKTAEKYVMPYLKKGSVVLVSGTPKLHTYPKKDGSTGFDITVRASDVQIMNEQEKSDQPRQSGGGSTGSDDDIPFSPVKGLC